MTIRPPAPTESGIVAELVLQSDCGLLTTLFGADVRALLSHPQSKPFNPYCSANRPGAPPAAEARARTQGASRLVLDVEENNNRAQALYARLDYRPHSVVRIDLGRRGAFFFLRLTRGL